jgi:hypothetical protein
MFDTVENKAYTIQLPEPPVLLKMSIEITYELVTNKLP